MRIYILLLALLPSIALAQLSPPPYNPANVNITGGTITGVTLPAVTGPTTLTGSFATTGSINAQGQLSSTANLNPAGATNTGVSLVGGPNYAAHASWDATRTANNRYADWFWSGGNYQLRFEADNVSSGVIPISFSGGAALGITGIASTSGTGVWTHTGRMKITASNAGAGIASNLLLENTGTDPAASANMAFSNTNAPAESKFWDFNATSSGTLTFRAVNDANTASIIWLTVSRAPTTNGIAGITSSSGSGAWVHTGDFSVSGNMTIGGVVQAGGGTKLQTFLTSALPNCSAGNAGLMATVLDFGGTLPTAWNTALPAGTGTPAATTTFPVFCNGSAWTVH